MYGKTYDFSVEDIEYIRHGDKPIMLKLFRPQGDGPFPMVLDLHGGAWCNGDLTDCVPRDEVMAASGIVVASANFRHGSDGYPTSLVDINYCVRWLKANARKFGGRADKVGLSGTSSGGHLAMLAAMRPGDPRYTAISLPAGSPSVDASVQAVVMQWPVINPLSRYRHALRAQKMDPVPGWVGNIPDRHVQYWKNEDAMAEGNPILMMERGEKVTTVPALWIQGRPDIVHDYRDPDSPVDMNEPERFVHDYRKAGGDIEMLYIDNATKASATSYDPTAEFFHRHLR